MGTSSPQGHSVVGADSVCPCQSLQKTPQRPSPSAYLDAISRSKRHGAVSQPACTNTLLGDIYLLAEEGGEGERLTNSDYSP